MIYNIVLVSGIQQSDSVIYIYIYFFFSDYIIFHGLPSEINRDHSVVFETVPKYCILDSFVHPEGYSISSKGFLPTVVDIMVILTKLSHVCPF